MRNVSDKSCREKRKTHILCSVTFLRKTWRFWDIVEKYCSARQATDGNMMHAHCMLDTQGYNHTLRIWHCNNRYSNAPECSVIRTLSVWFNRMIGTIILYTCVRTPWQRMKKWRCSSTHPLSQQWMDVNNFVHAQFALSPKGKSPSKHYKGGSVACRACLEVLGDKQTSVPILRIEPQSIGRPARSQSLYLQSYPSSICDTTAIPSLLWR